MEAKAESDVANLVFLFCSQNPTPFFFLEQQVEASLLLSHILNH